MFKNFLKLSLLLSILSTVWGKHTPKVTATVLEGFPDDVSIDPFTRIGNKLYHFGQSKVSWFKAHLICRSMGGDLASFENQQEITAVSEYMKSKFPNDRWWWIAGSDLQGEGDFHWYNTGERMTFADWSTGQPDNAGGNENCVFLWFINTKYQMNDLICANAAFYVCEAQKPKTAVVTIF